MPGWLLHQEKVIEYLYIIFFSSKQSTNKFEEEEEEQSTKTSSPRAGRDQYENSSGTGVRGDECGGAAKEVTKKQLLCTHKELKPATSSVLYFKKMIEKKQNKKFQTSTEKNKQVTNN